MLSGQYARITQASVRANSKLIIFLTPEDYVSVTQEIRLDHTGTTNLEIIRHISQSCCFTSPTKLINHAVVSLGCHDRKNDYSSKANRDSQVLTSFKS